MRTMAPVPPNAVHRSPGLLIFSGKTDVGQKRDDNEDCFTISEERQYAILADGMGGRLFGEVASSMAVDVLSRFIDETSPRRLQRLGSAEQGAMMTNLLDEWIRLVNRQIFQKGQEDERYREMGTTLICALGFGSSIVLAHVGDSRAYLQDAHNLRQITEDHSFVNNQVKQGMMTEQEARESSQRNIITRALGTSESVKPDIAVHDLAPGERMLLCSDGLTDMVDDETVAQLMSAGGSLGEVSERLVDAANRAGGRDNITVILIEQSS